MSRRGLYRALSTVLEAVGVALVAMFVGAMFGPLWILLIVGLYLVFVAYVLEGATK